MTTAKNQSETSLPDSVINALFQSLPDSVKNAVFQEIERRAGVDPNTLKVIRAEYRVWNDGCLGVQSLGAFNSGIMCAQVLTPGWIAEVEGKDQRWVYHTNETGTSVVEVGSWSESSGSSTFLEA